MQVTPYLDLNSRCEEAMNFYVDQLGATVVFVSRWRDAPEGQRFGPPEGIMHATFKLGETLIHASDGCGGSSKRDGMSLSIGMGDSTYARRIFAALAEGGTTVMPFQKTFWSDGFGMVTDKFGVQWMICLEH